ncbi:MAG: hypothetical protein OXL41_01695 [Nitrospinae bacterium]|nr:hypothetical protein [Nitrospinota bacterium]
MRTQPRQRDARPQKPNEVDTHRRRDMRRNVFTAEHLAVMAEDDKSPVGVERYAPQPA